jgi:hypothetical protein
MGESVPFPPRRETPRELSRRLADKLQRLVLTHPVAAIEVEKLIDRLLAELNR